VTLPRHYLTRGVYAVSRRCHGRKFLLKPTKHTTHLLKYLLAHCLTGKKVSLLAFAPQTNHYHVVLVDLTEPHEPSDIDRFFQHFNALAARALNAHWGRTDHFWSEGSYHPVEIGTPKSLESQLIYAWANCVKDGMVEFPEDWPGFMTLPEHFGTTEPVQKPTWAFFGGRGIDQRPPTNERALKAWRRRRAKEERNERKWARARYQKQFPEAPDHVLDVLTEDYMEEWLAEHRPTRRDRPRSALPETVQFVVGRPPGHEDLSLDKVRERYRAKLNEALEKIKAEREQKGYTTFRGAEAIKRLDPKKSPKGAKKPSPTYKPRFACRDNRARHMELLERWLKFQADYERALEIYDEDGDPTFPLGTVLMLRRHHVRVRLPQAPP